MDDFLYIFIMSKADLLFSIIKIGGLTGNGNTKLCLITVIMSALALIEDRRNSIECFNLLLTEFSEIIHLFAKSSA